MNAPTAHKIGDAPSRLPLPVSIQFISFLMILLGIGALALQLIAIQRDPAIQIALTWESTGDDSTRPSVILAFLERFGLIVPLLTLYLSGFLIVMGYRLRSASSTIAHWSRIVLLWLTIGFGMMILFAAFRTIQASNDDDVITTGMLMARFLPLIAGMLVTGGMWMWLGMTMSRHFVDDDKLVARETRLAWNLLIPTLTIVILVAARPLEQTFIRSLTDKRFAGSEVPQFVGLDNYTTLLGVRVDVVPCRTDEDTGGCSVRDNGSVRWESIDRGLLQDGYRTVWNIGVPFDGDRSVAISGRDDDFIEGIWTTLIFTVVSVSLELTIGLFMALIVNSKFKGRGIMRAVMLIPWAIPTVISARLWELMLKDTSAGIVNKIFMDLNIIDAPMAWLSESSLQLPTAIIVDVWKTAPFMALLLLAGLQVIPKDLYEAASVDGANPVRRFFSITLPLLRPAIAVALVFRTLDALRVFDLFNVLFGRQQLSMATYNYETLVSNQLDGYASAVSVIIFIIISVFAVFYVRMLSVETD
ncbi:MAG: sugar ABC transporter permease [Aggregatilineales bacterium]